MFKKKVQSYINRKSLILPEQKVIVTLSGGPDSVALLRVLLALHYHVIAAHCNFHLRGIESDRDEEFVRNLCNQVHVPLYVKSFKTIDYANENHLSVEMAARELRYTWFDALKTETNADVIAVAHHRDDSVETILLNLIRGTGINGLRGIQAKNEYIIRPLLEVSRDEVLTYLDELHQSYVTDSTNLIDEVKRNIIRLDVMPILKRMNPSVNDAIIDTANHLSDVAKVYNVAMTESKHRVLLKDEEDEKIIDIAQLKREIAPSSVLFEILSPLGFNSAQIKDIIQSLDGQSGKQFSSKEWDIVRDRTEIIAFNKNHQVIIPQLDIKIVNYDADFQIKKDKHLAYLDADKLHLPLTVRHWKHGDKFVPFGMKGTKNVSDYLTDRKFSLFQKQHQFVACSGSDIVWLIEERIDNRYCVTEDTCRVAIVCLK
ncbi:MAG: tRNA lysidine(34) synthetase TilS [Phocaeicola sp.]|uniref:tRNA lysidine(34) synthetase TilS n=1 Tax=Phocaeicola sp. TaxID=2773926 RepID=UPI003F9FC582